MKGAGITCHLLLLFLFILPIRAMKVSKDTLYVQVKFQLGYSSVDTLFCDNKVHLEHLVSLLNNAASDSSAIVKSITIKGCASPEGYTPMNRKLSEKRAQNVRTYILNKTHLTDSIIKVVPSDVDWELLSKMIATTEQPWRNEAIEIIANTPIWIFDKNKRIIDGRKNRLCMLRGGRAWKYMKEKFFPDLRNARFRIVCEREMLNATINEAKEYTVTTTDQLVETPSHDSIPQVTDAVDTHVPVSSEVLPTTVIPSTKKERQRITALLKTNMLYDVATIPNIGLEVAIGQQWSVGANWQYAWWSNDAKHRFWRVYGGDAECRYWFSPQYKKRSTMCGHHVGLYGQMLTYDIEWGGRGYLGDRWSWGAGLSYGYSLPIGRQFNIDFTLGVGYLSGDYMKYQPEDNCYVWESTRKRKWFGPTKAEVSLVWYIGGRNELKGGVR